jgi:carbamoyltransferase
MYSVGVNRGHNSSTSLLNDGEIVFHLENERLTNIKYDWYAFQSLSKIKDYTDSVDQIAIAGLTRTVKADVCAESDLYTTFIRNQSRSFLQNQVAVSDLGMLHHKLHAACSFYNSGFSEAICIVKDGMGSDYPIRHHRFSPDSYGRENGSVFLARYPNTFDLVENHILFPHNEVIKINEKTTVSNNISEAYAFNTVAKHFGYHGLDAGKVMGLSSYGQPDKKIPKIYKNGYINNDLFKIEKDVTDIHLNTKKYPYLNSDDFQVKVNLSYALQQQIQKNVRDYILRMVRKTGCKNVCLSGGYFLNCVANYYIIDTLPDDITVYVEPISNDAGTSLGAAKLLWHTSTQDKTIRKLDSLYLGPKNDIDINRIKSSLDNESIQYDVTPDQVADIITNRNVVALFQDRSESGPRSLGNRSILYDPRDPNGKDIVNQFKKREWFRPFAGTVLHEHCHDWFNMSSLDESPFMMYAVKVLRDDVPAITHVDKTCRVQTLKKEQNVNYYNLIESFHKKTDVPILLNTSLNLGGDCIAEEFDDALYILRNSQINYLYLPELKILVLSELIDN